MQLHKQLGDKVIIITVDLDFTGTEDETPEQHREKVLVELKKRAVSLRNFISSDPDTVVYEKLGIASIPCLQVFDRNGKLHKRFDNEKDDYGEEGFSISRDVRPVIQRLLK